MEQGSKIGEKETDISSKNKLIFLHKQADALYHQKEYIAYRKFLEKIIEEYPLDTVAYIKLGVLYLQTDTPGDALPYLKHALKLSPDSAVIHRAFGHLYRLEKNWKAAIEAFTNALKCEENNIESLDALFNIYRDTNDWESAVSILQKLISLRSDTVDYYRYYADILRKQGKDKEALQAYTDMMRYYSDTIPYEETETWIRLSQKYARTKQAKELLLKLYQTYPDNVRIMCLYGKICEAEGESDKALELLLKAHKIAPDEVRILHALAALYRTIGEMNESKKYYEKILSIDPYDIAALFARGMQHKYSYGDKAFRELNAVATMFAELSNAKKMNLHYALAKAYDDVTELDSAFENYKLGGILHSQGRHLQEVASLQKYLAQVKHFCSQNTFKKEDCPLLPESQKAVFIVGMPRSGTTLMERVLSGLDGVYGAGELPYLNEAFSSFEMGNFTFNNLQDLHFHSLTERGAYYLEQVEKSVPHSYNKVVDKMPDNFRFTGLIPFILPQASIIYARRHPMEICLSAYRISFGMGHYWSDNLIAMGKYFRAHYEMMQEWKKFLPDNTILEVRYEDMVHDLESESKRIAKHIGVSWSPECLAFHQKKGAIRTASVTQARQPLYKTSVNRWMKYEKQLKPLLDEIGDLVELYEAELLYD